MLSCFLFSSLSDCHVVVAYWWHCIRNQKGWRPWRCWFCCSYHWLRLINNFDHILSVVGSTLPPGLDVAQCLYPVNAYLSKMFFEPEVLLPRNCLLLQWHNIHTEPLLSSGWLINNKNGIQKEIISEAHSGLKFSQMWHEKVLTSVIEN